MKTEVCFCCGQIFQELTLWPVGAIGPRAYLSAEPWSDVITTPSPLSIPDEIGHEAGNNMTSSEPHSPSHLGRPVLFNCTPKVSTDAGRSNSAFTARTCDNPALGYFHIEGRLSSSTLGYDSRIQVSDTGVQDEVGWLSATLRPVWTENVGSQRSNSRGKSRVSTSTIRLTWK
jgi:hypothetical protein